MSTDTDAPSPASGAIREAVQSLRSVFANPALRRIQLALAGSMVGDWAYATAVSVWAYTAGGVALIGRLAQLKAGEEVDEVPSNPLE